MMPVEKDEKAQPILPRLSNKVETIQSINRTIRDTIRRLNRSIGDETEAAKKLEPMPKKDPGEFEMLEALINDVVSEMELSLKALDSFANRTLAPPKVPSP